MMQPLALILFEKLLPGSQLVNRLQDLGYRVQSLSDPSQLTEAARQAKPLLVLADLAFSRADIPAAIRRLRQEPETQHLPVIAFSADTALHPVALAAGATLIVSDVAVLNHLAQCLEQALHVE